MALRFGSSTAIEDGKARLQIPETRKKKNARMGVFLFRNHHYLLF